MTRFGRSPISTVVAYNGLPPIPALSDSGMAWLYGCVHCIGITPNIVVSSFQRGPHYRKPNVNKKAITQLRDIDLSWVSHIQSSRGIHVRYQLSTHMCIMYVRTCHLKK